VISTKLCIIKDRSRGPISVILELFNFLALHLTVIMGIGVLARYLYRDLVDLHGLLSRLHSSEDNSKLFSTETFLISIT